MSVRREKLALALELAKQRLNQSESGIDRVSKPPKNEEKSRSKSKMNRILGKDVKDQRGSTLLQRTGVAQRPTFDLVADNVLGKIEPTALELDCMGLKYLDIFLVATMLIGGSYFLSTGASLVIRYTQHFLKIFPMFLLTITNMATSIELQSIAGLTDDI